MFTMSYNTFVGLLVLFTPCIANASSILAFATVGVRSHQLGMLRIGEELVRRGHQFTLLLSSQELLAKELSISVSNITIVTFMGPAGLKTHDWFANIHDKDLHKVGLWLGFRHKLNLKCTRGALTTVKAQGFS